MLLGAGLDAYNTGGLDADTTGGTLAATTLPMTFLVLILQVKLALNASTPPSGLKQNVTLTPPAVARLLGAYALSVYQSHAVWSNNLYAYGEAHLRKWCNLSQASCQKLNRPIEVVLAEINCSSSSHAAGFSFLHSFLQLSPLCDSVGSAVDFPTCEPPLSVGEDI